MADSVSIVYSSKKFEDILKIEDLNGSFFSLVDIAYDPKDFKKYQFIYEAKLLIDEQAAYENGVTGIKFDFSSKGKNDVGISKKVKGLSFVVDVQQSIPPDVKASKAWWKSKDAWWQPVTQQVAIYDGANVPPNLQVAFAEAQTVKPVPIQNSSPSNNFLQVARKTEIFDLQDTAQILSSGKILGVTINDILNFGIQSHTPQRTSKNFDKIAATPSTWASLSERRMLLRDKRRFRNHPVIDSFVSLVNDPSQISVPNFQNLPVKIFNVSSTRTEYTRQFVLPAQSATNSTDVTLSSIPEGTDKLFVNVSFVTDDGYPAILGKQYEILHSNQRYNFDLNPEPPTFVKSDVYPNGQVGLHIRRNDKSLKTVSLVRIIKHPINGNSIKNLGQINFEKGEQDNLFFMDTEGVCISPNTVIYRAVTLNNGTVGEFSSIVPTPIVKKNEMKHDMNNSCKVSLIAINSQNSIDINVEIMDEMVSSFRLLRQDTSIAGEYFGSTKSISYDLVNFGNKTSISTVFVGNKKGSYKFVDTDVANSHTYRYFLVARLGTLDEISSKKEVILSQDEVIQRILPPVKKVKNIAVGVPTSAKEYVSGNESITAKFDIEIKTDDNEFNTIIDALKAAGVDQKFINDLKEDTSKSKLKQIAVVLVERVNLSTGQRFFLGRIEENAEKTRTFIDDYASQLKNGAPPLQAGISYKYICKLAILNPAAILTIAKAGLTKDNGDIFNVSAFKYFNAVLAKRGILPSKQALLGEKNLSNTIQDSLTGVEVMTSQLQIGAPSFSLNVEQNIIRGKNFNVVKWTMNGNVSLVNYFLVYCNYNGIYELLGTVSSYGSSGTTYTYKDTKFCNEVGKISYVVQPVLLDNLKPSYIGSTFDLVNNASCSSDLLDYAINFEAEEVTFGKTGVKISANTSNQIDAWVMGMSLATAKKDIFTKMQQQQSGK